LSGQIRSTVHTEPHLFGHGLGFALKHVLGIGSKTREHGAEVGWPTLVGRGQRFSDHLTDGATDELGRSLADDLDPALLGPGDLGLLLITSALALVFVDHSLGALLALSLDHLLLSIEPSPAGLCLLPGIGLGSDHCGLLLVGCQFGIRQLQGRHGLLLLRNERVSLGRVLLKGDLGLQIGRAPPEDRPLLAQLADVGERGAQLFVDSQRVGCGRDWWRRRHHGLALDGYRLGGLDAWRWQEFLWCRGGWQYCGLGCRDHLWSLNDNGRELPKFQRFRLLYGYRWGECLCWQATDWLELSREWRQGSWHPRWRQKRRCCEWQWLEWWCRYGLRHTKGFRGRGVAMGHGSTISQSDWTTALSVCHDGVMNLSADIDLGDAEISIPVRASLALPAELALRITTAHRAMVRRWRRRFGDDSLPAISWSWQQNILTASWSMGFHEPSADVFFPDWSHDRPVISRLNLICARVIRRLWTR